MCYYIENFLGSSHLETCVWEISVRVERLIPYSKTARSKANFFLHISNPGNAPVEQDRHTPSLFLLLLIHRATGIWMKGSDRQAAKTWAINTTIQGTEKPERGLIARCHAMLEFSKFPLAIQSIGYISSRCRENIQSTVQGSARVRKITRHVACVCELSFSFSSQAVVVCFPAVHYPRPKYEHGTSTPGWRYIFGISIASSSVP